MRAQAAQRDGLPARQLGQLWIISAMLPGNQGEPGFPKPCTEGLEDLVLTPS